MKVPILISLLGLALLGIATLFASAGGAAGVGYWLATSTEEVAPGTPEMPHAELPKREPKLIEKVRDEASSEPVKEVDPTDGVVEAPKPAPVKPAPKDDRAAPRPKPATAAPQPEPDDTATFVIVIASMPLGADVKVDGKYRGVTPVLNLELTAGPHTLEMVGDSESTTKVITLGGRRTPARWVWVGGDNWEEYY